MEEKFIKLGNISTSISLKEHSSINISRGIQYLCMTKNGCALVFLIGRNNETCDGPIWECCDINSFIFSDDGDEILFVSKTNNFKIYKLHETSLVLTKEISQEEISLILGKFDIEFTEESNVKVKKFSKKTTLLFIENKWLILLERNNEDNFIAQNNVEVSSCVTVSIDHNLVFALTAGGNVSTYNIQSGQFLGVVHLYAMVPPSQVQEVLSFRYLCVDSDNKMLVVSDRASEVFLVNLKNEFARDNDYEQGARWDCGASIKSFGSDISRFTTSSHLQHKIFVDTVSLCSSVLQESVNKRSSKVTWSSYLQSLYGESSLEVNRDTLSPDMLRMLNPPTGLTVRALQLKNNELSVWYTEPDTQTGGVYYLHDLHSGSCIKEHLSEDIVVIPGGLLGYKDAFVSSKGLYMFLGSFTHDILISKLVHCMEMDSLGRLLQSESWTNFVVPLPAVATALTQKRLDVAQLALNLHVHGLKNTFLIVSNEDSNHKLKKLMADFLELLEVIQKTCSDYDRKPALREQLIASTLEQINRLLDFLCSCQHQSSFQFMQRVMLQVVELRKYLSGHYVTQKVEELLEISLYCPEDLLEEWNMWTELDDESVIKDAVLKNLIPLCQVFFIKGRSWSKEAFLLKFDQSIDSWISELINKSLYHEAEKIFEKVGRDPYQELLTVCVNAEQQELRDLLAQYLSKKGHFPTSVADALKFLRLVEDTVNIVDFSKLGERTNAANTTLDLQNICEKIPVSKVLESSEEWRQNVLISLFFNIPGAEILEPHLQPDYVWLYLLEHNCDDFLCLWITCSCSKKPVESLPSTIDNWAKRLKAVPIVSKAKDCKYMSTEHMLEMFKHWNLTEKMVNSVASANAMAVTKEIVLNHLSRYGIFCDSEKSDVKCILKRTIFTGNVNNLQNVLSQISGNVTFSEFQCLLTKHLIENDLHEIAFPCLEDFEYSEQQIEMFYNSNENNSCEWLSLWFVFRELKRNPDNDMIIYNAILQSAKFLSKGNLKEYLKEHPLVVLALIIFEGKSIAEVLTSNTPGSLLDDEILSATLKHYPVIEQAMTSFKNSFEETPDITVYELLEKNAPFDVSKVFSWKQSQGTGETLPHFLSPKLVEKFGAEYKMTYLIYLRLARPCFAACRFAVDQYQTYATLSQKRIKDAVNTAHWLALKHYHDIEITSACLAFAGILGEDSSRMKVDLECVKKVCRFLKMREKSIDATTYGKTFGEMVNDLIHHSSNAASNLLDLLEKSLTYELEHQEYPPVNVKSVEEIAHWGLAVKFARLHCLKLPEVFMKQLAAEDNLLLFMLFAEIYRYPMEQVKELSTFFTSFALQEHLFHALQVEVISENKPPNMCVFPRDVRKSLYSKILPWKTKLKQDDSLPSTKSKKNMKRKREVEFPNQQKEATDKIMGLAASLSSGSSAEEAVGNSLISYDVWGVDEKDDIFIVLLKCHNALDPQQALLHASYSLKNPVLSVFATCYDLSMVVTCFCTWLMASLPTTSLNKLENWAKQSVHDLTWDEQNVSYLLEEAVSINFIATLQLGCWIFFPDNPLDDLLDFLYEAIEMKDFEECILKMKLFKAALMNLKHDKSSEKENLFWDSNWLGRVAVNLCIITLSSFTSVYFILEFLTVLIEGNFLEHLPEPLPDLKLVHRIVTCLELTDVYPNIKSLIDCSNTSSYKNEVNHCLEELLQSKQFSSALQLTTAAGLSQDPVLIAQWSDKFEQSSNKSLGRDYMGFWKKCDDTFHKEGVQPEVAAQFFQNHAGKVEDLEERFRVLQLAVMWLKEAVQTDDDHSTSVLDQQIASAEFLMWNCWLQADTELPLSVEETGTELLYVTKDKIIELSGISHLQPAAVLESDKGNEKVNLLIGKLLDLGNLISACRVEVIYSLKNQDLRIVFLCLGLAEGTVSPYELTAEQRLLFCEIPKTRTLSHRRRALMSSITTLSHSPGTNSLLSDYVEIPPRDRQDTLSALEKLTARLKHGLKVGNRIVMCYRVAMNLDMNYLDVLMLREPLNLLRTALADDCLNKFIVASDIINAAQINSHDIAEFMSNEILEAVIKSKLKGEVSGTTMWGIDLESSFHLVLDVCRDHSALGKKLLALASQTSSSKVQRFRDALVICVELIIHAHNCFVAALNIEGIGSVLQMCQTITNKLVKKQEWALMVRLLTGVERYTEMQYVFKILYDNEQFEYLLAKGLDKFKGLKVAVVDFLKRRCPEDLKLCEMVSLRFGMFEELAIFWESDGLAEEEKVLQLTVKDPSSDSLCLLPNSEDVKKHLITAMDCFKHAAEFFLKGELLIRATRLVHHAELIALQRFFISTVPLGKGAPLLLRLNKEQVSTFVTHLLTFPQAYLLVRAYEHSIDWADALYQHCVLDGDESYFSSFVSNIPLNSSLVEDIVRRFQVNRNISPNNEKMMKKFIERVDSLELKYRLASQLGFRDLIEALLNGPEDDVAYLKDTVWQHGYRR